MKLILTTLFFFIYFATNGFAINDRVSNYYRLVNKANMSIIKGEMGMAYIYFDSAFSHLDNPFFIDVNNAIYAHLYSRIEPDTFFVNKCFRMIAQKGIVLKEFYKGVPVFLDYINQSEVNIAIANSKIDSNLVDFVNKAYDTDQILREYSIERLDKYYHPDVLSAIDVIDSINYFKAGDVLFTALERKVSLENLIGLEATKDLEVILLHNVAWHRYDKELMDSMIHRGLLDARQMSHFYDYYCNVLYITDESEEFKVNNWSKENHCKELIQTFGTSLMQVFNNGTILIPIVDSTISTEIEARRHAYYLMNLMDDSKIRAYSYINRSKGFSYYLFGIIGGNQTWINQMKDIFSSGYYNGYLEYQVDSPFKYEVPVGVLQKKL